MKKLIYIITGLLLANVAIGQVPQINNIDKKTTFPGDILVFTGSNFSNNAADLKVWFGAVEGEIVSASTTLLQVRVPEEARFDNIYVTNIVSGLTGYTSGKFFPFYNGEEDFVPSEFSAPLIFNAAATEKEFYDLCACDLDSDGKPDITATKVENPNLVILKNNSTPGNLAFDMLTFVEVPNLNLAVPTLNVVCGDLNGDGKPDIVVSRSGATRNEVFVLQNTSTGPGNISFSPFKRLVLPTGVISRRIKIADFNFDGRPELVITDSNGTNIYVFENNSTLANISFLATPESFPVSGADTSAGIEIQDLDGDRKPDIIVTQFFKQNVYILRNNSTSSSIAFGAPQILTTTEQLLNVKAGDLNNDGLPEIIATSPTNNRLLIFENTSTQNISFNTTPVSQTTGTGAWGVDLADLNGDGEIDIVVGNQNQTQINVFINNNTNGDISLTKNDVTTDLNVRNIIAGDLDGDGKPDMAYGAFSATGPYRLEIRRNLNCYVPEFTTEEGLAICPTQVKRLDVIPNAAATFTWKKDGTTVKTSPESFLEITEFGEYTVEASTEGGSCVITDAYSVGDGTGTIPGDPIPSGNTPVCEGETLNLTVQDIAGAVYKWTGPNGFTSNLREPTITNVDVSHAGLYKVNIKLDECLSNDESVAIDVATLPIFTTAAAGPVDFCAGGTNQLSVTNRGTGYTYQWQKDNALTGQTGTTITANSSGSYNVLVTDNTTSCFLTTEPVVLEVFDAPVASFQVSSASACEGEGITITNNSTTDPDATVIYAWALGNGTTSSDPAPQISYEQAGNFNLQLAVSYEGINSTCSDQAQQAITVTAATLPEITAPFTEICPGESLQLSIESTFAQTTWSTGQNGNSIFVNEAGIYTVSTIDNNGCAGEDSFEVTLKATPQVVATAHTDAIPATTDTIRVNSGVLVKFNATGADSYSWTPEEPLSDPLIQSPELTPTTNMQFFVTGTLTGGCSSTDSIYVKVNTGGGLPINPKKVFSPESTINPTWEIDLRFLNETCQWTIFDDRGVPLVENSGDYITWDGSVNGDPLPEGVYYYVVGCPESGSKAGTVLLVRQ